MPNIGDRRVPARFLAPEDTDPKIRPEDQDYCNEFCDADDPRAVEWCIEEFGYPDEGSPAWQPDWKEITEWSEDKQTLPKRRRRRRRDLDKSKS